MPDREYYKSERFIWDGLRKQAAAGVAALYKTWKNDGKVTPFALSWPSETILDDSLVPLEGACVLDLPLDRGSWSSTLVGLAQRTKSYALLLTEQLEGEVRVILESHHGTRSWTLPIHVSGDVRVLGTAEVKDDTHRIGILWGTRQSA